MQYFEIRPVPNLNPAMAARLEIVTGSLDIGINAIEGVHVCPLAHCLEMAVK